MPERMRDSEATGQLADSSLSSFWLRPSSSCFAHLRTSAVDIYRMVMKTPPIRSGELTML